MWPILKVENSNLRQNCWNISVLSTKRRKGIWTRNTGKLKLERATNVDLFSCSVIKSNFVLNLQHFPFKVFLTSQKNVIVSTFPIKKKRIYIHMNLSEEKNAQHISTWLCFRCPDFMRRARVHSFSTYAKFSEKLTFLTP